MGVYIPNMEMPTSCEKCPFLDYEEGFCFASGVKGKSGWYEYAFCPSGIKGGRHKDCPLVPVPPHGRLIDADALMRLVDEEWFDCQEKSSFFYEIGRTPTIIPAEEADHA